MNWKLKAMAQNVVSALPSRLSYDAYYFVQRRWGGLRDPDPLHGLKVGVETWRNLLRIGYEPSNKIFFELGTGRAPIAPLAFWLMGAKKVITCDLNPYVSEELTFAAVRHIVTHTHEVRSILDGLLQEARLRELCVFFGAERFRLRNFMEFVGIDYRAPFDARKTRLADCSIDVHTSYTVLEHISKPVIVDIMHEARRILCHDGIGIHLIDYSDHFSHSDPGLHWLHFLRYSEVVWSIIAGNRYMFMNRLRHDDYLAIGEVTGLRTETIASSRDEHFLSSLFDGRIVLATHFRGKSADVLAVQSAWVGYRPA